jgi:tetratricopeptide (TPR) repeat protein
MLMLAEAILICRTHTAAGGDAYFGLKQYDKAISDYTEAIRLEADNTEDMADTYRKTGSRL